MGLTNETGDFSSVLYQVHLSIGWTGDKKQPCVKTIEPKQYLNGATKLFYAVRN